MKAMQTNARDAGQTSFGAADDAAEDPDWR